jgi:hypothetical protein
MLLSVFMLDSGTKRSFNSVALGITKRIFLARILTPWTLTPYHSTNDRNTLKMVHVLSALSKDISVVNALNERNTVISISPRTGSITEKDKEGLLLGSSRKAKGRQIPTCFVHISTIPLLRTSERILSS